MLARLFDRLRSKQPGPATPEQHAAPQEPKWLTKALEGMSTEDQATMRKIRHSFESQGKNQQWYYSGAGTDIIPTLISPDDAAHHFVDPYYAEPNVSKDMFQYIASDSLFKDGTTTQHPHEPTHTTHLEGGMRINWIGKPAEDATTVPDTLDVIYTNSISHTINPVALERLRVDGMIVFDGHPTRIMQNLNHPTYILSPLRAGIEAVTTEEPMLVKNMNPGGSDELLQYGKNRPHLFNVFRKSREFTEDEKVDMSLNQFCLNLFFDLRSPLFHFTAPAEQKQGYVTLDNSIQHVTETLEAAAQHIEQNLPVDKQQRAKKQIMEKFKFFASEKSIGRIAISWLEDADTRVGNNYFNELGDKRDEFIQEYEPLFQHTRAELKRLLS